MQQKEEFDAALKQHYVQGDLSERILKALKDAGKDIDRLTPEDLAPIDEFHTLGRMATLELAKLAGIEPGMHVLDVGCGVGGPSRCLAGTIGCRVTGVDLMQEYCAAAEVIAQSVKLSHLVDYQRADALALPFSDSVYDVVWSQHTAMNIEDKTALYRELNRVLKPGGILAIFDVLALSEEPIHFPVPWSRTPETSYLISPEELRCHLAATGFSISAWKNTTEKALDVFTRLEQKVSKGGLPSLGTQILLGPVFESMILNQVRNFQERRIAVVQIVARKTTLS